MRHPARALVLALGVALVTTSCTADVTGDATAGSHRATVDGSWAETSPRRPTPQPTTATRTRTSVSTSVRTRTDTRTSTETRTDTRTSTETRTETRTETGTSTPPPPPPENPRAADITEIAIGDFFHPNPSNVERIASEPPTYRLRKTGETARLRFRWTAFVDGNRFAGSTCNIVVTLKGPGTVTPSAVRKPLCSTDHSPSQDYAHFEFTAPGEYTVTVTEEISGTTGSKDFVVEPAA